MFSLVHYVLLLEKLCIAQNGFMKVSGTYFISEFNNFFPVQHIFFFSERIPSRIIFFYICLYLLFRKKVQQDVIILICSYYPILFQIREETLSRRFVNLSYFIRRIRKRILFLLEIHFPTKNILFTSLSLSNSYVAFKFSKYKTIDLSPPPPFLKPFLYQNFINFPFYPVRNSI